MSILSRLFGVPDGPAEPPKVKTPKKRAAKAAGEARPASKAVPKANLKAKPTTSASGASSSGAAKPAAKSPARAPARARARGNVLATQDTAPTKPVVAPARPKADQGRASRAPSEAKDPPAASQKFGVKKPTARPASARGESPGAPSRAGASRSGAPAPAKTASSGSLQARRPKNAVASERPPATARLAAPEPEEEEDLLEEPLAPPPMVVVNPSTEPAPEPAPPLVEEEEDDPLDGGRGKVKVIATGQRARLRGDVGKMARTIEKALIDLGAPAHVVAASVGPTITRFGLAPAVVERYSPDGSLRRRERIRVSKIASRANDLALVLGARTLRIEAPVPGQSYVGLEVPNLEASSVTVASLLAEKTFKEYAETARLPFALGRDVAGKPIFADVTRLPHLLVAGSTGAGKSVALNALLGCLLKLRTPEQLRILVLDPKRVEFGWLERVGHLLAPVVVEPEEAVQTLGRLESEMSRRYDLLANAGVRDLARYNAKAASPVPYLLLVVDELADLMMLASSDVERSICRLAQLGRAAGIHLVVATQRPSVDVVTGLIKANLPARLAFAVASQVDSRTVLDSTGAELLLGRGDFLYQAPDAPKPVRGQGAYVSEEEVQKLARRVRRKGGPDAYAQEFAELETPAAKAAAELLRKARDLAISYDDRVSASFLQRKLRIGYARAKELVEALREEGLLAEEDE